MATNQVVLLNATIGALGHPAPMYLILRDFTFAEFCPGDFVVKNRMPITSRAVARLTYLELWLSRRISSSQRSVPV